LNVCGLSAANVAQTEQKRSQKRRKFAKHPSFFEKQAAKIQNRPPLTPFFRSPRAVLLASAFFKKSTLFARNLKKH